MLLLASAAPGQQGGFVIFEGRAKRDVLQYALDPNGLQLFWPTHDEASLALRDQLLGHLVAQNHEKIEAADGDLAVQIASLQMGQHMVLDDGAYCQVGRSVDAVHQLTLDLIANLFGLSDESEVTITLRAKG